MSIITKECEKSISSFIEKIIEEQFKASSSPQLITAGGYLTKKQSCQYMGASISKLNSYLRNGTIGKYCFGGRVLVKRSELEGLIKEKK